MTEGSYDVVIVGGGVIGSSAAYFLAAEPDFDGRIAVIERDPTYTEAATPRSAGGIRQQFSTPENMLISAFGASFIKSVEQHLTVGNDKPAINFHEDGYLFLATRPGCRCWSANQPLQHQLGASTELLDAKELGSRFPWLNTGDLAGGSFGPRTKAGSIPIRCCRHSGARRARSASPISRTRWPGSTSRRRKHHRGQAALGRTHRLRRSRQLRRRQCLAHRGMVGLDLPVQPRKR